MCYHYHLLHAPGTMNPESSILVTCDTSPSAVCQPAEAPARTHSPVSLLGPHQACTPCFLDSLDFRCLIFLLRAAAWLPYVSFLLQVII